MDLEHRIHKLVSSKNSYIHDDCTYLSKSHQLISTDTLVENVHFDLNHFDASDIAHRLFVCNYSDIQSSGGYPEYALLNISFPSKNFELTQQIIKSFKKLLTKHNIKLIGGDTTSSKQGLQLSVTALGAVSKTGAVLRSGAAENDLLVLSGDIGGAYMGLQVLVRENEVFKVNPQHKPDLESYSYLVERQLKPEARKDVVQLLKDLDLKPTAMIDISDGLSSEIMHLCKQSGVGCRVYENKFPLDPHFISVCEEFKLDSTTIALSGGEDYELLFTIKQADFDKIKGNPNLTVIGHMTAKGDAPSLVTRAEEVIPLKAQGWKAF
mgnify:CR=1 FL=1